MELNSTGYEGLNRRKKITSYTSVDEYVESFDDNMHGLIVKKAEVKNIDALELPLTDSNEIIQLKSHNYATISSNEMIVSLNTMNKNRTVPKEIRNRTHPVYINRGFSDFDEFLYEIPEGYNIESTSKNVIIEKPFGTYSVEILTTKKEIIFKRRLILKEGIYPIDHYYDLIEFYKVVTLGDNSKAYLHRLKSNTY